MRLYRLARDERQLEVYRFPYEPVDSNMFFMPIGETGVVFDPNENGELLDAFERHGTRRIVIALTHEHYDHTSGVEWLRKRMEARLFCQEKCAEAIATEKGNDPRLVAFVLSQKDAVDGGHRYERLKASFKKYALRADETFGKEANLAVGDVRIRCHSTPGHSPGSAVYILNGRYAFTGDSLIQDTPTVVRFPESDMEQYSSLTRPFLESLDKDTLVFPGHGEPFKISQARYL